jgi:hypothetical protein
MWWLDPLVALTCGIGSLVYGLVGVYKAYVKDGLPIYSCSWWMYGSGDEDNEVLTNNQGGSTSPYGGASLGRGDDGVEMREEII